MFVIPLTTEPNQRFQCTIPIDGDNRRLSLELRYNAIAEYWNMTIHDPALRRTLIDSLPILVGEYPAANLLEQYTYLNLGSATVVAVGPADEYANPDDTTLGTNYMLVWGDSIERLRREQSLRPAV
jgi:hypothetical protein